MSQVPPGAPLLLVDDNEIFCGVLGKALARRGYAVAVAHDPASAAGLAQRHLPDYAVVDLKMPGASGLTLIGQLKAINPAMRIVVLTGYASIATAVEAVKLGATHYLAKPADADAVVAALAAGEGDAAAPVPGGPPSVERLEWEHIQNVLAEHAGNISATARALNMHRRTLQRKLAKRPVKV